MTKKKEPVPICPLCKSSICELRNVSAIAYYSTPSIIDSYYVCLSCGIMFTLIK